MSLSYICPGCGKDKILLRRWSGTKEQPVPSKLSWIECLYCSFQGPKKVWDVMVRNRNNAELALNIPRLTDQERRYLDLIGLFGQKMFRELKANDRKKGDFSEWLPDPPQAISELEHHFTKLICAINNGKKLEVSEYCADLANIAVAVDKSLGAE